jgi:hypothetical protein
VEGFEAAPVVRFYGGDVATVQPSLGERASAEPGPERIAEPARLRPVPAKPFRAALPLVVPAVLVGLAAVALATWAFVAAIRAADDPSPPPEVRRVVVHRAEPGVGPALALLARPTTERVPVAGSLGRILLAITPGDRGFLVVRGLGLPPSGRVYRAWLIPPAGRSIRSAASFTGKTALVPLRGRVGEGAAVAITVEHAGSSSTGPSRTPRLVAVRP